jgi:hypothetical protein
LHLKPQTIPEQRHTTAKFRTTLHLSPNETDTQAGLDKTLEQTLGANGDGGKTLKDQPALLGRMGLCFARDAVLGGLDYLNGGDEVETEAIERLRRALARECPDIPPRRAWRPEHAAWFCDSLRQVPLCVLRSGWDHTCALDWKVVGGVRRQSIEEFLAKDEAAMTDLERQFDLKALALAFAGPFVAARWSRLQSEG